MSERGQSLVEVLVAVAMGALLIIAGAALIAPALQNNKQGTNLQNQTEVGRELGDNVRAWAVTNWNSVLGLSTSTTSTYYMVASTSPFTVSTGTQSVTLGSTTYTRYFTLKDVYRDSSGNATSTTGTCVATSTCYDPSTKQITIVYGPQGSTATSFYFYITRSIGNVAAESDWSGGTSSPSNITQFSNLFTAATSITYSVTGQLTLSPPTTGGCIQ